MQRLLGLYSVPAGTRFTATTTTVLLHMQNLTHGSMSSLIQLNVRHISCVRRNGSSNMLSTTSSSCNRLDTSTDWNQWCWGQCAPYRAISSANRQPQLLHIRCAASASSSKEKTVWVCSQCGKEHVQWVGKCQNPNCKAGIQHLHEKVIRPEPPPSAASGASAAAKVMRGTRSSSSSSSSKRLGRARTTAANSWEEDLSGPEFDSYDQGSNLYDREEGLAGATGGGARSAAWSSGWVSPDDQAAVPQRLSDMQLSTQQLRLPLLGATGEEVARVLGGGLVPGSLVLVGGEPGMGKSTLLLQVAGLVAQACNAGSSGSSGEQQQQQEPEELDEDADADVPLAARLAAAAAAANGNGSNGARSSSSSIEVANSWLDEAHDAVADGPVLPVGFQGRCVLYITAEESRDQVWERARRLGVAQAPLGDHVRLLVENRVEVIAGAMAALRPAAVVVDSIQTVALREVAGRPGSITQVRECASCLLHVAKAYGIPTFLVGHVTKTGSVAGPKHLEHLVDVVVYLQGASRQGGIRMLRATKNRHGRVGEVGLFEMRGAGLSAVKDAAALFAPATAAAAAAAADEAAAGGSSKGQLVGTAVGVVQEGIRPLPLEIQALATARLQETVSAATADAYDEDDSYNDSATDDASETELSEAADEAEPDGPDDMDYAGAAADGDEEDDLGGIGFGSSLVQSSRKERVELAGTAHELAPLYRHYVGVADRNRMAMLLELLTKHTPIKAHLYNLFINVVAGVRIQPGETSTDLAILAAIASSVANRPLPPGTALLAEIGLAGELRAVPNLELRLLELSKLGFSSVVVPAAGGPLGVTNSELGGMTVERFYTLRAALNYLFGEDTLRAVGWYRKKKGNTDSSSANISSSSRRVTTVSSGGESSGGNGDGSRRRSRSSRQ